MNAIILTTNLLATFALWWEIRRALALSWQGSVAYGVGLAFWYVSATVPAFQLGFEYGIYGVGK